MLLFNEKNEQLDVEDVKVALKSLPDVKTASKDEILLMQYCKPFDYNTRLNDYYRICETLVKYMLSTGINNFCAV